MKRQCTDPNTTTTSTAAASVFSDDNLFLNPNLPLVPYSSPLQLPQQYPLPFPDNHTTNSPDPTQNHPDPNSYNNNNHDGASVENQRRPRGRPLGSKNKPKSPNPNLTRLQLSLSQSNQQNHQLLEIPNGADIINSIVRYTLRHNTSLRILHASGAVANVTVRQSNLHPAQAGTLHGRFDVLSLSAVFLTPSIQSQIPTGVFNDVAITLSIPERNNVGGFLVGPLMASGSVFVLVEMIPSLTFHQLEFEENGVAERENNAASGAQNNGTVVGDYVPMYNAGFMPY